MVVLLWIDVQDMFGMTIVKEDKQEGHFSPTQI